jgi:hypothetical protein
MLVWGSGWCCEWCNGRPRLAVSHCRLTGLIHRENDGRPLSRTILAATSDPSRAEWSDVRYNLGWVTLPGYGARPYPTELFDAHWKSYNPPLTAFLSRE